MQTRESDGRSRLSQQMKALIVGSVNTELVSAEDGDVARSPDLT